MPRRAFGPCALCERETRLTFHHLVPRSLRSKRWFRRNLEPEQFQAGIDVCRPCHNAIHRFIDHKTLGREYNTLDALRTHPELSRFVAWLRKQDPGAWPKVR